MLEGEAPTRATQPHLDRCLTCRTCESTCPSGVQYGHMVDIGRKIVEHKIERPAGERAVRWLLKEGLTSPLFAPAMKLGQMVRPHLPASMKNKVPAKGGARAHQWPQRTHARKVLMLMSCVQPAMMPNINAATARVLDAAGIQTLVADGAGCCGATVKDYAHHLAHDPHYAEKAQRISALTKDVSELLAGLVPALMIKLRSNQGPTNKLAFHAPHLAAWPAVAWWRRERPA